MHDIFDKSEREEAQRQELIDEENRYARLSRVFATDDGIEVLEWLLEHGGYWRSSILDERSLGKFELVRFVFNQICVADTNIIHRLIDRRTKRVEAVRLKEKKRIEKGKV